MGGDLPLTSEGRGNGQSSPPQSPQRRGLEITHWELLSEPRSLAKNGLWRDKG